MSFCESLSQMSELMFIYAFDFCIDLRQKVRSKIILFFRINFTALQGVFQLRIIIVG